MNKTWQKELLASKIDESIINLNFQYLKGDAALERLLYALDHHARDNKGRLRTHYLNRYSHCLDGGWWVSGIDLETLEPSDWGCFKPDQPRNHKYESPPDAKPNIFALQVSDAIAERIAKRYNTELSGALFWEQMISDPRVPIIVTEGAKKAGALLSAGYCAIALSGISSGYVGGSKRELIPPLALLATGNRRFFFAFDQDTKYKTRQAVKLNIKITGELIEATGCNAWVIRWEPTDGKGTDDLLANKGEPHFYACYRESVSLRDYQLESEERCKRLDEGQLLELLNIEYGDKLRWNELTSEPELNGRPFELSDDLRFWFAEEYRVKVAKNDLYDGFVYCAKKNAYNPVLEYLNRVEKEIEPIGIEDLATRYLGTTDHLYDIFLKKTLIAAVARVFEPGCKSDCSLILQGEQGQGKSTFFKILGGDWFNDSCKDIESKDALQVLHRCWIQELSEFDRVSSRKAAGVIKAFLSASEDMFRKPYGREPVTYPRKFVIVGSVNKAFFLLDETGNRRFWVVPLPSKPFLIPTDQLRLERDAIWAGAIAAYRSGETWWLNSEESDLLAVSNEEFVDADAWDSLIAEFIQDREYTTVLEIMDRKLDLSEMEQTKSNQMRVSAGLTRLGWKRKRLTINGKRDYFYLSPEAFKKFTQKGESGESGESMPCNASVFTDSPQKRLVNNLKGESETKGEEKGVTHLPLTHLSQNGKGESGIQTLPSKVSGLSDSPASPCPTFSANFSKKNSKQKYGLREDEIRESIAWYQSALNWTERELDRFASATIGTYRLDLADQQSLLKLMEAMKALLR